MVVKSYRGLLPDGGQDKIRLTTTDGRTGYRIIKFQLMAENPGTTDYEYVVKIYKNKLLTASITGDINFTDTDLVAAGYLEGNNSSNYIGDPQTIIFDNEMFNQDIYVSHFDAKGTLACNYYLELEQINLSAAQAEVLIVKDLRKQPWTRP